MNNIEFHGYSGQGAVTSTERLARAVISENRFTEAFQTQRRVS